MSIETCEGCSKPICDCPGTVSEHLACLRSYANGDEYQRSVEWGVGRIDELERENANLRQQLAVSEADADRHYKDAEDAHERAATLERKLAAQSETLKGIADADWRKLEELASPEEFVRWAKARATHALAQAGKEQKNVL